MKKIKILSFTILLCCMVLGGFDMCLATGEYTYCFGGNQHIAVVDKETYEKYVNKSIYTYTENGIQKNCNHFEAQKKKVDEETKYHIQCLGHKNSSIGITSSNENHGKLTITSSQAKEYVENNNPEKLKEGKLGGCDNYGYRKYFEHGNEYWEYKCLGHQKVGYNEEILNSGGVVDIEKPVNKLAGTIILLLQVLAVGGIIFDGVRYMFATTDVKADIKKTLPFLIIGIIIVFAAPTLITFITNIFNQIVE